MLASGDKGRAVSSPEGYKSIMKLKVKENETLKQIKDYLEWHKWKVYKLTIPRYSRGRGLPDLLAIRGERILFLECKSPTAYYDLTDEQREFIAALKHIRSVEGCVVRDIKDLEEYEKNLKDNR